MEAIPNQFWDSFQYKLIAVFVTFAACFQVGIVDGTVASALLAEIQFSEAVTEVHSDRAERSDGVATLVEVCSAKLVDKFHVFLERLRNIQTKTGSFVELLHHTDMEHRPRGSGTLQGLGR